MSSIVLWQLVDSAFPSGGFAHSWGLESAYQAGEVASDVALRQFLRDSLWQAGHAVLPAATTTYREPDRFEEIDAVCDAFLTNGVANRASRQQGRALLSACARIWPSDALAALDVRAKRMHGHYAAAAGAALQTLGMPLRDAQQWLLFSASRGVLAAAVRLGIVGPFRAQQLQHECSADLRDVLAACGALEIESLTQTAPVIDLLQSAHDRLYSRLFQS
jgi:urease accessory protein